MSVFKKLKDVLFDVEEEEIPVITKEEKRPVREEPKREVNPIKEVKMPKEEVIPTRSSNFNFPLDYKVSEGCIEVVIDDFEGFDDDWAEITRDYENPEAVDAFEKYVAEHESELDFEIYVDYTSSDI